MRRWHWLLAAGLSLPFGGAATAGEPTAAERGWDVLRARAASQPLVSRKAYDNVWKQWGVAERPADYDRAVRTRYGLVAAPYDNGGLPMGFGEVRSLFGKGIGNDCLLCHAGSIAGQTVIGLGNASLDLHSLFE